MAYLFICQDFCINIRFYFYQNKRMLSPLYGSAVDARYAIKVA